MAVYEIDLTVPTTATETAPVEVKFWVLGNYITHVEFIFPSGSARRTYVSLYYGIKKLYPFEDAQWFKGNDETFKFDTLDQLPDSMTKLRFVGFAVDARYPHTIGLRIVTSWEWELAERIWLKDLLEKMELLLRRIGVM